MDKTNLTVLILIGVVIFIVGAGLGIFYQSQAGSPSDEAVKALSSKVVPSIIAYGQVTDINGQNITLTFDNDSLIIPVAQSAVVYSFTSSNIATAQTQKQAQFSDLKVGDYINISVKVTADGNLEGQSVIILPAVPSGQ